MTTRILEAIKYQNGFADIVLLFLLIITWILVGVDYWLKKEDSSCPCGERDCPGDVNGNYPIDKPLTVQLQKAKDAVFHLAMRGRSRIEESSVMRDAIAVYEKILSKSRERK